MTRYGEHLAGERFRGHYPLSDVAIYELERWLPGMPPPAPPPATVTAAPLPPDVNEDRLYAICGAMASR
ncbi:MAG TPA: hypothetical protein VGN72_04985 [Tepidisphaeraceae bacterium]|jgi:hypothetical protein|nr:hypothetical protein [Tepidisphaeraceae bacterium]